MIGNTNRKPAGQAIWKFQIDEEKKADSLQLIRQAVRLKRIQKRLSFAEKALGQLRFQTWQQWAVQGCVLIFAMLFVLSFYEKHMSGLNPAAASSVFLVFAGNICLSSTVHLFSWHMAELEKTLYLDLKQMVCIRMLEAGVFDLLVLGILTGFLGGRSECGIFAYLLYLIVPFLWSEVFYLHMLAHVRSVSSGFRQLCFGILCGAAALFPVFWKDTYLPEYVIIWGIAAAAGCLLLAAEIFWLLKKIDTGEGICQIS